MSQNNAGQSRRGDRLYYDKLYSQLFSSTIDMCFIISYHFLHLCLCFLLYKLRMPTSIKDTIDWSFANETAKKLNRQHTSEVQRNKIKYTTNEMSPNIDLGDNYLELKNRQYELPKIITLDLIWAVATTCNLFRTDILIYFSSVHVSVAFVNRP